MIRLTASCFGKLPLHGDFIRHRAVEPELSQLDSWFQEGIYTSQERLGDSWGDLFSRTAPVRFVSHRAEAKTFTCGVIVSGRDKVGRLYPFVVYTVLSDRPVRKQPELLPLLLDGFLAAAEELATGGWEGLDLDELRGRVDALSREADLKAAAKRLEAYLNEENAGSLWGSTLGNGGDRKSLLLMNLKSLLGPRSRPTFPLGLPLAAGADQATFWLRFGTHLRGGGFPTLTLWNASGDQAEDSPGLRLLLVPPGPKHYLSMFSPAADKATLCDMSREGLEVRDMVHKAKERFGAIADDNTLSLEQLIRKTHGVRSP